MSTTPPTPPDWLTEKGPPKPPIDWLETAKKTAETVGESLLGGPLMSGARHIGDITQKQVDKVSDDPSRWFLNTAMDLGLVSAKTVQNLSSPENLALMALMASGQPEAALPVLANLGFSASMAKDATQSIAKGIDAAKHGNLREAGRLWSSAGVNALLLLLAANKGPKGASYRESATPYTERLPGEVPARKTSTVPLPTAQEAEIATPPVPEQRMDAETRLHVQTLMELDPTITREEALQAVRDTAPRGRPPSKLALPEPKEPVPAPPNFEHPEPVRSGGKVATVTPDDIRAYVGAKTGTSPMQVVGPEGRVVDLADDSGFDARRIRAYKLSKVTHDELFPGAKYRPGMTVGDAVDAKPGVPHPETGRKFSSTQIDLPKPVADGVRQLANSIPDSDLSGDGRETKPHVTVKYGLHDAGPEKLQSWLRDTPPITLTLGKTGFFPPSPGSDGNDVVYVEVDSPQLHEANSSISKAFPVTDTHPEFKPHITLAYVKPGAGQKYAGNDSLQGSRLRQKKLLFRRGTGSSTQ